MMYGLQLRVNSSQKKESTPRQNVPSVPGFGEDDEDDVEKEISRQAAKNRSLKEIEDLHKKALNEDPLAFAYDEVYDDMKAEIAHPRAQDRQERKPKYIEGMMQRTKERQQEREMVFERNLVKERLKDDHMYADKEKFVTNAYKKRLAEQAKWKEEELRRQIREEKDDVTKKDDLSDFYFNIEKNVAFGANGSVHSNQKKQAEPLATVPGNLEDSSLEPKLRPVSPPRKDSESSGPSEIRNTECRGHMPDLDTQSTGGFKVEPEDRHRRNEDALKCAKERYMARKKARCGD